VGRVDRASIAIWEIPENFAMAQQDHDQQDQDWIGRKATKTIRVTADMIDRFAALSGDTSPIHMSDAAAQNRKYAARVAHGMLLGSLVSSVLGTQLPGEEGVLQQVQLDFRKPCYPGDEITIHVEVTEFFESVQVAVLKVEIIRSDGVVLTTGQVQSGLV
jgi:3-hydroxybutyryl-CoA dehydratase